MKPRLPEELEQAVAQHHGTLQAEGNDGKYVVMSMQVFREMMGVGSDAEMAESLRAIDEGLADIEAGRTRPFREFLDELGRSE